MKVWIKGFDVGMEIKTKGIELEIRSPQDRHLGDLVLTKTKIIWCKGRTGRRRGKSISLPRFIDYMESL